MDMIQLVGVALAALLSENLLLVNCIGTGTHIPAFSDPREARRTGTCVTLAMVITVFFTWLTDRFLLEQFICDHFRVLAFTLISLFSIGMIRLFFKLFLPALSLRLDHILSTLSANGAALGAALMVSSRGYELGQALVFALFGGLGVLLALLSFAGLRESIRFDACPKPFQGLPITLITVGLMAMALVGFYGLHIG